MMLRRSVLMGAMAVLVSCQPTSKIPEIEPFPDAGEPMEPVTIDAGVRSFPKPPDPMPDAAEPAVDAAVPDADIPQDSDAGTPPPGFDLTGDWAAELEAPMRMQIGPLPQTDARLTALAFIRIERDGDDLEMSIRLCDADFQPQLPVDLIYPQPTLDAMDFITVLLDLPDVEVGSELTTPEIFQLLGYEAEQPAVDAVPTTPDDPRLVDEDGDGRAGVTLQVTGLLVADLGAAVRIQYALSGTVEAADRVSGRLDVLWDQVILESSNPLIATGPVDTRPDPDADGGTFSMLRVTGGTDSCAKVVAEAADLFPE